MGKTKGKIITILLLDIFILLQSLNIPQLLSLATKTTRGADSPIRAEVDPAEAAFEYIPASATVAVGGETVGSFLDTREADQGYYRIFTTSSGVDVTFTIEDVMLFNANHLVVMYDGYVSSATLTYQIQIKDFTSNTWRNIIPHEANYSNTADGGRGLTLQLSTTGALSGGYFPIYNGYFSDGSNNPISTPLSNFVNNQKQAQLRIYSDVTTADLEMAIDLLMIQASNSPIYRLSSLTIAENAGSISSGEYNDTITDDNNTNLVINAGSSGIDVAFKFENVALPYSDANTYLIEFSGFRTTITNYSITIRDFQNSQWDTLSATALTNTSDDTYYFALVPSTLSQNMSDYIQNNQMQVRAYSSSTSGSLTIDLVRITIGSTATNSGIYTGSISRGLTQTGDVTNTRDLDTSNSSPTNSAWIIDTSNTDARTDTEYASDCNSPTNHCASANITFPVTVPDNTVVQGVIVAFRFTTSAAALDLLWTIRDYDGAFTNITNAPTNQSDVATNIMHVQEISNPMPPRVGEAQIGTPPTFTPHRYADTLNNAMLLRFITSVSDINPRSVNWDFAFMSVKTILPHNPLRYRWTPSGGTITYGSQSNSNYRFTKGLDTVPWIITPDVTNGIDAYLSFTGVTVPTGANKMILTSRTNWSVGSRTFEMYVYDFSATTWRELTPHETNFTSDTNTANYDYEQFEVFDGYFSDGANSKISTPLSNFVSAGEVRLRIMSTNTNANLSWDFALLQYVIGTDYFNSGMTITSGTVSSGEYNDTFTYDNTSNLVVAPSSNEIDFYFSFTDVVIPPEGFNALLLNISAWKTSSGNHSVQVYNFTDSNWEAIVTDAAQTVRANHNYLLNNIDDFSNYIGNGEMRIRMISSGSSTNLNIDFIEIVLGTAPGANTPYSSNVGQTFYGDVNSLTNLNSLQTTDTLDSNNFLMITTANSTTGIRALDELSVGELEVELPFHVRPGTVPAGIYFMYRGQTGSTSATVGASIEYSGGHFRVLTSNGQYSITTLNGLPNTSDTATLASATQATITGIYDDLVTDLPQEVDNRVLFRIYTASGSAVEAKLIMDAVFMSYRWIPTETEANPESQMRHGKWWFGGLQQKDAF